MNNFWLKKTGILAGIFLLVIIFNLSKSGTYESETDILLLPKNEVIAKSLGSTVENFRQIVASLAFFDRLSAGSEALAPGVDLPNYRRKEFWSSKLVVERADKSSVVRIENFDMDGALAQKLNNDTVENLVAVTGNYYNIKTDLELRIIDGPIVKKVASKNLAMTIGESLLWAIGLYFILSLLLPVSFIEKGTKRRELPGRDFGQKREPLKKTVPAILPEEDNYFATKNFFGSAKKAEEVREAGNASEEKKTAPQKNTFSLPNFPSFGKKAPTPANLPVSEEGLPDIFRQKAVVPEAKETVAKPIEKMESIQEQYIPHEATPEEVKARLNRLLSGGK